MRSGTRVRLVTLLLLAVGGLAGLVVAGQPWWRLLGNQVDATVSGTDSTSGLAPVLPVCVLVAGLLALVLRGAGRRVLGALLTLIGGGMAVLGGWHPAPDPTTVRQTLRQSSLGDASTVAATAWPWLYLVCGVLTVAAGVLLLTRSPSWPQRADRYAVGADPRVSTDPDTWWKAMDAGIDPTVPGAPPDPPAEPPGYRHPAGDPDRPNRPDFRS